ncbi:MAG: hypothetical protein K2M91_11280 [Lachnospiraceae bacterium]|nr:hypothetical protein [Lachnospiraceae bacterium]
MEVITELIAKQPGFEIDGSMSEEMEAKVREKRIPGLTPTQQLVLEIDRFTIDYYADLYHNNIQNMTENVSELVEAIEQGGVSHITTWLADVITEGTEPEETKRAIELLEKLAEYKPLAKIEDNAINGMEVQNYNMVDNVLNNGAGKKTRKEENKKSRNTLRQKRP